MSNKLQQFLRPLMPQTPAGFARGEYLDQRYFFLTVFATLLMHLTIAYVSSLAPQSQVLDIPVRVLNIKLGDGEEMTPEEIKAAQPDADNKSDVESAISKMVQTQETEAAGHASAKSADKVAANDPNVVYEPKKAGTVAKQYVRANPVQANSKNGGSTMGNSTAKEAELMSRYEQLISLWIEKFKKYPDEARSQNMQGETVVRIRIDRQGNILYYILEHSTGFPVLDHAAIDMVKRANPVPAVPNDYPKGDMIEFLIPVNFHLQ